MAPLLYWLLAICSSWSLSGVSSANILAIPLPVHSHCSEMNAVASELVKRNHKVTVYLPQGFNAEKSIPDLPTVRYGHNITSLTDFLTENSKEAMAGKLNFLTKMGRAQEVICTPLIKDIEALRELRKMKFDFAIVDYIFFHKCLYLIPYNLSIPYASISSVVTELDIGHPVAASIVPFAVSKFGTKMMYHERIANVLYHFLSGIFVHYFVKRCDYKSLAPELSWDEVENLPRKSEIFLENSDIILSYPKPFMPNVVQVGGLTTKPPKALPSSLQKYFEEATAGVVIMSFGSIFKDPSKNSLFFSVLKKLKQRVFWKCDVDKRVGNIWMSTWLPQNDALGHPNTKLLIYHCGNNGIYESMYNGVALLCLPLAVDQFVNAEKLVYLQVGRFLRMDTLTEDSLLEGINDVINNSSYTTRMKHLSKIFGNRAETPAERAASALEQVIQTGGGHLRSDQVNLTPFRLLLGDVWLGIFIVTAIILISIYYGIKQCIRLICCKRTKEKIN